MHPLSLKVVSWSWRLFGGATFVACVVYGLIVPAAFHPSQPLEQLLPLLGPRCLLAHVPLVGQRAQRLERRRHGPLDAEALLAVQHLELQVRPHELQVHLRPSPSHRPSGLHHLGRKDEWNRNHSRIGPGWAAGVGCRPSLGSCAGRSSATW